MRGGKLERKREREESERRRVGEKQRRAKEGEKETRRGKEEEEHTLLIDTVQDIGVACKPRGNGTHQHHAYTTTAHAVNAKQTALAITVTC